MLGRRDLRDVFVGALGSLIAAAVWAFPRYACPALLIALAGWAFPRYVWPVLKRCPGNVAAAWRRAGSKISSLFEEVSFLAAAKRGVTLFAGASLFSRGRLPRC